MTDKEKIEILLADRAKWQGQLTDFVSQVESRLHTIEADIEKINKRVRRSKNTTKIVYNTALPPTNQTRTYHHPVGGRLPLKSKNDCFVASTVLLG